MIFTLGIKFVLKKHSRVSFILIIILAILLPVGKAGAQDAQPEGQVYIVQPGDTLSGIAAKFGVSTEDLISANGITDPDNLVVGTRLIIPGPGTIQGEVVTVPVTYGTTLRSLSRRYRLSQADLALMNRIASPAEIYAGSSLVLPKTQANVPCWRARHAGSRPIAVRAGSDQRQRPLDSGGDQHPQRNMGRAAGRCFAAASGYRHA